MLREYEMVLRAAADRSRARILKLLEDDELCVCQVVAVLGLGQSTVSKHLSILREAGLIEDRKEGRWVFYRLGSSGINRYSVSILGLLRTWLNDDEMIAGDAERLRVIRETPVEEACRP
ncbi:MAG: ArsR/SmtB family transcription factor [Ignavibacteriales bacterium]